MVVQGPVALRVRERPAFKWVEGYEPSCFSVWVEATHTHSLVRERPALRLLIQIVRLFRKVDVRLPGKGNSNVEGVGVRAEG